MNHMTISEFRANLSKAFDMVRKSEQPILVTQGGKEPMLLAPLDLLKFFSHDVYAPKLNALDEAIAQANRGERIAVNAEDLRRRALAAKRRQQAKKKSRHA